MTQVIISTQICWFINNSQLLKYCLYLDGNIGDVTPSLKHTMKGKCVTSDINSQSISIHFYKEIKVFSLSLNTNICLVFFNI